MIHLDDIVSKEVLPGFFGKFLHGEKHTLAIWDIKKGSVLPEHVHEHEQITHVLEGELEMIIGGEKYVFTAGMSHIIVSNTPHSAIARHDSKVVDSFSPARDDYR
ncbi:MAG: cupin domain-containing protein [Chitinophagaceae bacterium]